MSSSDDNAIGVESAGQGGPPGWAAAIVLLVAIGATYWHALAVPFIFDDVVGIGMNGSTRSLWPLVGTPNHRGPLNPGHDLPTAGRPLVNLSFALNYAISGESAVGYHATNVAIHFLVALLLWAIVRRTLRLPYFVGQFHDSAGWLALATAMLWALHPLQTETVVYITQRTEQMMTLFYFATLYCGLRYWGVADSSRTERGRWLLLAFGACLAGMASKEVMVSAPIIVLLFERTFVSGSLGKSLRRSWPLYAALASTWLLLLALNVGSPRGNSAGFRFAPPLVAWWLTQTQLVLIYLKLVFWPWPLLIHYQLPLLHTLGESWLYVIPIVLLVVVAAVLLWRNTPTGFLFTWVIAILAPTSVVPILTEMGAERRMYLPLAAIVALTVVAGYRVIGKLISKNSGEQPAFVRIRRASMLSAAAIVAVAAVYGVVSARRVFAYDDLLNLWNDVVQHQPRNYLAHTARGMLLETRGQRSDAIADLRQAVALKPDHPVALNNLGAALNSSGLHAEAVAAFQSALAMAPDYPETISNLAQTLLYLERVPEAVELFEQDLRLRPDDAAVHNNMADALMRAGKPSEAVDEYKAALALANDNPNLHSNFAGALTQMGRYQEAIDQCREALELQHDSFEAHYNLGIALLHVGKLREALVELRAALELKPDDPPALNTLGAVLLQAGMYPEAKQSIEHAVRIKPDYAAARNNLGQVLARTGDLMQAIEQFRLAVEHDPKFSAAHVSWALALAEKSDFNGSIEHFEKAIELGSDIHETRNSLGDSYRKSGDNTRAIEQYEIAVRKNPSYMVAYANLAQTLALVDRSKEAVAISQKAIEVARSTNQLDELGQFEEWLKHYQTELRRAEEAAATAAAPPAKE